ncbi:MAG: hypothetical protein A2908_00190 [Candidatus Staskawiczbacteria bacterium RIFCSPLOWO2_01_FULL_38_12b]|uniref:histidine kinase n=1 Tax=Candidatus Staskawiczbacteria bacterium RIFCSPLOWO2_01_FULL_38_12b TaxID=1802214 RepID=A0A1G2IF48_9BACT|nr:MAG: hypothetical protein A2908_00190 [Candidatus Staskawiczbacteria bacterium RIFCSPLOWO2_01_FULL_38_12b]
MLNLFNRNKKITEELYEHNLELAVKNKTLSLLEKLYQTSILTLTPKEEAKEIADAIRKDLSLELVGLFVFEKETDSLNPLVFSKSERLVRILYKLGFLFHDIAIKDISKREFFKKVVHGREYAITNDLEEVWKELITSEHLRQIKKESHIKTILLYPLIMGNEVFGVLLLGFNRDYETLNAFEKASIKSFINVIALLLDKAYLYKNLQDSYEITKKAYAVEKQAKEELEKLDKIKNQFLAQTQHDLRTPLGIIRDYCDLLMDGTFGKQGKKSKDAIKRIQVVAENKIKDVNNFLDTTQFQLGKKVVLLAPGVALNPILEEVVAGLEFQAKSKGIYLTLENPLALAKGSAGMKEALIIIRADREKLKAALFNVIDNSIKYTPKGGVRVKIEDGDTVKITVSDTGIGIPKEKLQTLFDTAFERGEEAKKTFATGRGIGLYLSSQIIKAHNGKVWAESEGEGKGSVFHIELPINKDSH